MYCFFADVDKVKKLCKELNFKLTPLCLKYYLRKTHSAKNLSSLIQLFVKDGVKPNYDILVQYINIDASEAEKRYMCEMITL